MIRLLRLTLLLSMLSCSLFADYGGDVNFTYQIGGTLPAPDTESIISTTPGAQVVGANVFTSGQSWLSASISSTTSPFILTISVNPVGLAAGSYMGNAVQGSAPPASQTVVIGGSLSPGAMVTSSSTPPSWLNAGWIAVGTAAMSVPISINPSFNTLAPGTYTTTLVFDAPFTSQEAKVLVTLNVAAPPPVINTSMSQLQFSSLIGGTSPAAQTVQITSSGSPLVVSVTSNAAWLSVSTATGTTPLSTSVAVNPANLAVGTYNGQLTVATTLGSQNALPVTINVRLTITADNKPSITSVVNWASFKSPISPGSWVTIKGKNLAPSTLQSTANYLFSTFNGVSATISGPGGNYSLLMYYTSVLSQKSVEKWQQPAHTGVCPPDAPRNRSA